MGKYANTHIPFQVPHMYSDVIEIPKSCIILLQFVHSFASRILIAQHCFQCPVNQILYLPVYIWKFM